MNQSNQEFNLDEVIQSVKQDLITDQTIFSEIDANSETIGEASQPTCNAIIQRIHQLGGKDSPPGNTILAITFLLQKGATSPRTPGAMMFPLGGTRISVDIIRQACRENKVTVRQFARGIKQLIIDLLLPYGDRAPDGNLAKTMRLELRNVTKEEAIWASDFQTYNDNCPIRVKNWLVKNYRSRFRKV